MEFKMTPNLERAKRVQVRQSAREFKSRVQQDNATRMNAERGHGFGGHGFELSAGGGAALSTMPALDLGFDRAVRLLRAVPEKLRFCAALGLTWTKPLRQDVAIVDAAPDSDPAISPADGLTGFALPTPPNGPRQVWNRATSFFQRHEAPLRYATAANSLVAAADIVYGRLVEGTHSGIAPLARWLGIETQTAADEALHGIHLAHPWLSVPLGVYQTIGLAALGYTVSSRLASKAFHTRLPLRFWPMIQYGLITLFSFDILRQWFSGGAVGLGGYDWNTLEMSSGIATFFGAVTCEAIKWGAAWNTRTVEDWQRPTDGSRPSVLARHWTRYANQEFAHAAAPRRWLRTKFLNNVKLLHVPRWYGLARAWCMWQLFGCLAMTAKASQSWIDDANLNESLTQGVIRRSTPPYAFYELLFMTMMDLNGLAFQTIDTAVSMGDEVITEDARSVYDGKPLALKNAVKQLERILRNETSFEDILGAPFANSDFGFPSHGEFPRSISPGTLAALTVQLGESNQITLSEAQKWLRVTQALDALYRNGDVHDIARCFKVALYEIAKHEPANPRWRAIREELRDQGVHSAQDVPLSAEQLEEIYDALNDGSTDVGYYRFTKAW